MIILISYIFLRIQILCRFNNLNTEINFHNFFTMDNNTIITFYQFFYSMFFQQSKS